MKREYDTLEQKNKKLQKEYDSYKKKKISDMNKTSLTLKEQKEQIEQIRKGKKEIQRKLKETKSELEKVKSENKTIKSQLKTAYRNYDKHEKEIKKLKELQHKGHEIVKELQEHLEQEKAEHEFTKETQQEQQDKWQELQEDYMKLETTNSNNITTIDDLTNENDTLQSTVESLQDTIQQIKETIKDNEETIDLLTQSMRNNSIKQEEQKQDEQLIQKLQQTHQFQEYKTTNLGILISPNVPKLTEMDVAQIHESIDQSLQIYEWEAPKEVKSIDMLFRVFTQRKNEGYNRIMNKIKRNIKERLAFDDSVVVGIVTATGNGSRMCKLGPQRQVDTIQDDDFEEILKATGAGLGCIFNICQYLVAVAPSAPVQFTKMINASNAHHPEYPVAMFLPSGTAITVQKDTNTPNRNRTEAETFILNIRKHQQRICLFSNANFKFTVTGTAFDEPNHKYIADIILC